MTEACLAYQGLFDATLDVLHATALGAVVGAPYSRVNEPPNVIARQG